MVAVTRESVVVDGNRISYLECGDPSAPVVLLVHGMLSDSGTWADNLEPLGARGLRAIAIDLLGHGESDAPRGPYLLDDYAILLDGFLDALELKSATICGHSLGGAIAVHFGYHYPDRVERFVLVSAGGLGREVSPALRMLTLPGAEALTGAVLGRRTVQRLLRSPRVHRARRRHAGPAGEPAPGRPVAVPCRPARGVLPVVARRDRAVRSARLVPRDGVPRSAPAHHAGLVGS